jgi:dihydropteroate synthase
MPSSRLSAPERSIVPDALRFRAPKLMGVVNATPDSFYAGSRAQGVEAIVARALSLVEEGADYIDIGGQSTRPGSQAVTVEAERERVIPVIAKLAQYTQIPISIDTDKAVIAAEALAAGARIINDISAFRADPDMPAVAARAERVIMMHMLGDSPKTMQNDPQYSDVVHEVHRFLEQRVEAFIAAGGKSENVWVDPGIGFGKNLEHNLALIKHISEFTEIAPVVLGVSRKSFFSKIHPDSGPEDRLPGSLAIASWAGFASVDVLRVHDVAQTKRALEALAAVMGSR